MKPRIKYPFDMMQEYHKHYYLHKIIRKQVHGALKSAVDSHKHKDWKGIAPQHYSSVLKRLNTKGIYHFFKEEMKCLGMNLY